MTKHPVAALLVLLSAVSAGQAGEVDLQGDPLPPGAITRLGTVRWRVPAERADITWSTNGKTLFVTTGGYVRHYDPSTGLERSVQMVTREDVSGSSFHPTLNRLLTWTDQSVVLWDVAAGNALVTLNGPHPLLGCAVLSPDGKWIATQSMPGTSFGVWNAITGQQMEQFGKNDPMKGIDPLVHYKWGSLYTLTFSPDSRFLAACGLNGSLILWDVQARKSQVERKINCLSTGMVAFSPDGKFLAWSEADEGERAANGIRIWDFAANKEIQRLRCRETKYVKHLCFSPNSKVIAVCEGDAVDRGNFLRCWNIATGKELMRTPEQQQPVSTVLFSPDGGTLLLGVGRALQWFDGSTGQERSSLRGHCEPIKQVAWSTNGKVVGSLSCQGYGDCGFLSTWDVHSRIPLQEWMPDPAAEPVRQFGLSPDGGTVVSMMLSKAIIQDNRKGRILRTIEHGAGSPCRQVILASDGKTLTILDTAGEDVFHVNMGCWSLETGEKVSSVDFNTGDLPLLLGSFVDGSPLFLEIQEEFVRLQGGSPTRILWSLPASQSEIPGNGYALSADGRAIALPINSLKGKHRQHRKISVRETLTGQEIGHVACPRGDSPFCLALSANGRLLAMATRNEPIRVWRVGSDAPARELRGHRGSVTALAFSPDGSKLLSGGEDTTVLVWDLADPPPPLNRLSPAESLQLWNDLAGDARSAHRAMERLAQAPDPVSFLKQQLQPVPEPDAKRLAAWAADLDHDEFERRQEAERQLARVGRRAESVLRAFLEERPSLEGVQRAERLLERFRDGPLSAQDVQRHRAVAVLERIGSGEAIRVLETLAPGSLKERSTAEVRATLARLAWRQEARAPEPGSR
jgi:WD40 repeat protein